MRAAAGGERAQQGRLVGDRPRLARADYRSRAARNREHQPVHPAREARRDERARHLVRLHHQHRTGQPRYQPVAGRELPPRGGVPGIPEMMPPVRRISS